MTSQYTYDVTIYPLPPRYDVTIYPPPTPLGATMALGLMFLKTHNETIASYLKVPETHVCLGFRDARVLDPGYEVISAGVRGY